MKVLIAGAGGMVGRAVLEHCAALGDEVSAHDHQSLDIADAAAVSSLFERERPQVIINCAAWTDVDGCQTDRTRAFNANARGPKNLATSARHIQAGFVTISTDYVFDGVKDGFYTQRDDPNPVSVYGVSKLEGERLAQSACARTTIVRTGWIFGSEGRNFLSRVVELSFDNDHLKAISDAWGTPTYAPDLARRLRQLAELDLPGIYHVVNSGDGASFEEFTREALRLAGSEETMIESVQMASLKRAAPRPRNSRLRCLLSEAIGLPPLPDWRLALKEFVERQTINREDGR